MRVFALLLLLFTNLQCNGPEQKAPVMNDMDRLQGTWLLVTGERHGEKFSEDVVKNVKLTFSGNVLKTIRNDDVTEAVFTLHPETSPKGMDLNMDGSLGLGIYKLEGDELTIVHGEVDEPRPANFDSIKSGTLTMLVLQKASN